MRRSNIYFLSFMVLTSVLLGCSKDEETSKSSEFVVAFENQVLNLSDEEASKEIKVVFSGPAPQDGNLQLVFQSQNLTYGNDFSTIPSAENGIIVLPIEKGSKETSFIFKTVSIPSNGGNPENSVEFSFGDIQIPNGISNGNTSLVITYSDQASVGGNFSPNVGGPNQPNQVFIDLSAQTETLVRRDQWDLEFYNGEEFRVKLNAALFMMAAELETSDLNAISESDVQNLKSEMAFLVIGSDNFVDQPNGNLAGTAISEISLTPDENKVYLLKMGYEIGTDTPEAGSVAISGDSRGWKKIRVLRDGTSYILQYADLNATSFQEKIIPKSTAHNFSYFSFATNNTLTIAPEKENWDLKFTTFTEVEEYPTGGLTAYGYSDYVISNKFSNVKAYQVATSEISYQNFTLNNVVSSNFETDQRAIGANWRDVFDHIVFLDRFYILKDTEGNLYKLKFNSMVNENGVRGYPSFEYSLLN